MELWFSCPALLRWDDQRSVRLNKKKKSTNTSPYPDEAIERLARAFYPAILACWNSEEGQREFAAWQAEQAHHANNEKQEVPAGELPAVHIILVCGFWQGASGWAHPVFVLYLNWKKTSFHTANHFIYLVIARYRLLQRASHNLAGSWIEHWFTLKSLWKSSKKPT